MTNAEIIQAIRTEVERRKGICTAQIKANPGQTFPFIMEMTGYDKLLSFLNTLQYSEFAELSAEIDKHPKNVLPPSVECEKGLRESLKEPVCKDLEEEIKRFQKEVWDYDTTLSDIARHFAQWGAEHTKK